MRREAQGRRSWSARAVAGVVLLVLAGVLWVVGVAAVGIVAAIVGVGLLVPPGLFGGGGGSTEYFGDSGSAGG